MRTLIRTLALRFHGETSDSCRVRTDDRSHRHGHLRTVYLLGPNLDASFDEVAASLG